MIFSLFLMNKKYADIVIDKLDKYKCIRGRFYRENCTFKEDGSFYKDLNSLNIDLSSLIIIDVNISKKNKKNKIIYLRTKLVVSKKTNKMVFLFPIFN